jgi:hypothetical protein
MPGSATGDRFLLRYLLTLLTISVVCAAFVVTFWQFMGEIVGKSSAMLVTVGYAFGTMALSFSMLLFSHALAAALLFWSFMALYRFRANVRHPLHLPLGAGLLAGYAVGCEYPTAIIAILLASYLIVGARSQGSALRAVGAYLVGAFGGFVPAMAYNVVAFGSPLSQGYAHLTNTYYAHGMASGVLGVGLPTLDALWGTSFSPFRGLFFLSPWLLLAVPGLWWMRRRGLGLEALLCCTIVVCYFAFQSGYAFWDGGASVGPRHFLPALPFLAFPIAFVADQGWLRSLARALVGLSVLVMAMVVATNPLFGDPHYIPGLINPLVDQTLRDIRTGRWQNNWGMVLGLHGWLSLVPLVVIVLIMTKNIRRGLATQTPVDGIGHAVLSEPSAAPLAT